jgi:hypothetical protein
MFERFTKSQRFAKKVQAHRWEGDPGVTMKLVILAMRELTWDSYVRRCSWWWAK